MKGLKITAVLVGALIITTLSIDASDALRGQGGSLLGQLIGSQSALCPDGMVFVPAALSFTCVDMYEVSAASKCPHPLVANPADTEGNLADESCIGQSAAVQIPWRYVTREQAARVCARSGKRLPSAEEWYSFALDTTATECQVSSGIVGRTGTKPGCVSAAGVLDTVGNVWEWVSDDVVEGSFTGRTLPASGYVAQVDQAGVATVTTTEVPIMQYDDAYFWSQSTGIYGMIRGGFYGSKSDAGVYTVHAHTPPTFTGDAVGFRCVR